MDEHVTMFLCDVELRLIYITFQALSMNIGNVTYYDIVILCIFVRMYIYIQGMSSLRSLIPFRLSHLFETSAYV